MDLADAETAAWGQPGSSCVAVTAPAEVDIATVAALCAEIDLTLLNRPAELCLDFLQTTFCASAAAYVLAGAAIGCHARGVSLRVIEGPSMRRLLDLAGLTGETEWREFACGVVVDRPSRLSCEACRAAAGSLTTTQLVAARAACWREYHAAATAQRRVASQQRLRIVQRELRARGTDSGSPETSCGDPSATAWGEEALMN